MITTTKNERLQAKVKAVNRANEYATQLYPQLAEAMRPFVGQQVIKATGGLLAKVQKSLPDLPGGVPLSVYRHSSDYSLAWVVKTCEPMGEYSCCYHESTVYVGNLRNGVLTELSLPFSARSDYTPEEIEQKRADYEVAKKAASEAQSALYPFGEYDQ